ncbi:hypothetical protein CLC19175_01566 [Campylobacter lari subsp. concheus]|uniref:hypothetical protein n=1 Tax=Campylobacter lari TaxID=201 RepID=UPI00214A2E7B|nr:hypothetical protein [Campylobacter lari]MCR2079584.1 hypothetical protein [Campylobacter lari subsp. concheus]
MFQWIKICIKNTPRGGGNDNFRFLTSLKNYKSSNLLKLSLFAIFSLSSLEAATEADYDKTSNTYIIKEHKFSNNDVYDYNLNTYKLLSGKNFYGQMASNKNLSNITLIYDNPKDKAHSKMNDMYFKQDILTPSIKEDIFVVNGYHNSYAANNINASQISYIPFLVSAYTFNAKANNNTLVLKAGELSSVYYLKPTDKEVANPQASGLDNKYNFLITPAIARKGEVNNNTLNFLKDAYVNMGVENTYTLPLNGAPYIVGAFGIDANANNNSVILNKGVRIDFHTTPYKQSSLGANIFDERMTHIVGAMVYNGNAKNNKVIIDGASLLVHGPSGAYSTSAATHLAGTFVDVNNNQSYEVSNNSVLINDLKLDLRVDTKNTPLAYNAILQGEIYGAKIIQGNAYKNNIDIKNLQTLLNLNANIEVRALLDLYGGATSNGVANDNNININLQAPFEINSNPTGKNEFNLYGGVATKGANRNNIIIKGDLTQDLIVENYQDKIQITAAKTLSSKANNNSIVIKNSNIAMPLYLYGVSKATLDNKDYYASSANANSIVLDNVKSGRNLTTIIEADNLEKNTIKYNMVQSLSNASNIDKGSKIILRANQSANDNILNIKDYSSAAHDNVYIIKAEEESSNNDFIFDNVTLGTASDKREGSVIIVAGISKNTHDNYIHINNLNIDEYKNREAIFIAPSATYNINDKSYNNTLYLSGDTNIFKNTNIDVLAGNILSLKNENSFSYKALDHKNNTNNHLILNTNIKANMVNNFDHYSFILKDNVKTYLSTKEKINISKESSINIYTNNNVKNKSFILMQSEKGFVDENNKHLNQEDLQSLLNVLVKNNKSLHKNIKAKVQKAKYTLSVSNDAKSIVVNLNKN